MITDEQGRAMLAGLQSIVSVEACHEVMEWIDRSIAATVGRLETDGGGDGDWAHRARRALRHLRAERHSVAMRINQLNFQGYCASRVEGARLKARNLAEYERIVAENRERKAEIKRRNIEEASRRSGDEARMFVEICRQVLPEEEYRRLWAAVRDAMAEPATEGECAA